MKVLFTPSSNRSLFDIRDYSHVEFFDDYDTNGLVEYVATQLHEEYSFTHVVYQAEQDIIRAARIREELRLPGQSVSSANCFRDKCLMKQILNERLPQEVRSYFSVPPFKKVEKVTDILEFIEAHGYPVVIKPIRGMGSINTNIVKNEEELSKVLSKGTSKGCDGVIDLEIEKFVVGEMYHIDGFVYNGDIKIMWPSKYINTCVGFLEQPFLGSYTLDSKNPLTPRLQKCTEIILRTLEAPPSYSFHVEIFHTPNDDFVFCEAACRTGGAKVCEAILELFEVNLNKAIVQAQCEDEVTSPLPSHYTERIPERNSGWIIIYPKVGKIKSIPKSCPYSDFVLDYELSQRRDFTFIEHCTDALSSFLVVGENEEKIKGYINKNVEWFLKTTIWE